MMGCGDGGRTRGASSAGQCWALDIAVSVPVAVATARMLAVAVSVLVFVPAKEAVEMA